MSDKTDIASGSRDPEDKSLMGPSQARLEFGVPAGTVAEVYHEIGNALSVLVPKLRLFKKHFEQIRELVAEFQSIDPDASAGDVKAGILRCRKLAERDRGIELHIRKLTQTFEPCFKELELLRAATEKLRGGRSAPRVFVSVDARKELEHIVNLFKEHLREVEGIRIDFVKDQSKTGSNSIEIACSPDELSYIFKNLVRNAVDAINEKRRLGGYKRGEELEIQLETHRNDGYVRIKCQDNGIGMSENVKKKIFNSFFTTKPHFKGTGVGLSIVKEIIEERGGKIEVRTEEGKGTVFVIDLPLYKGSGDGE